MVFRKKRDEKEIVVIDGTHVSPTVCEEVLEGTYDKISKKCYVSREKLDEKRSVLEKLNIKIIESEEIPEETEKEQKE